MRNLDFPKKFPLFNGIRKFTIEFHMIGWIYSGSARWTRLTLGGKKQSEGGKTGLRSLRWHINASSCFVGSLTMDFAPRFIKNGSLAAENYHFPDRRRFAPGPGPEAAGANRRLSVLVW